MFSELPPGFVAESLAKATQQVWSSKTAPEPRPVPQRATQEDEHGTAQAHACSDSDALTLADSPRSREHKLERKQDRRLLQAKKRKAQMRLVSLKRGHVKARPGEPLCLSMFVADVDRKLPRYRGVDGKFSKS
jgi:hypothetical protein